jgi:hypothetical protein
MIAITTHWTSVEYTIQTSLLAIREGKGKHTGENISDTVFDVAKEYNIVDFLGYFMMDGSGNNNRVIVHLNQHIRRDSRAGFNPVVFQPYTEQGGEKAFVQSKGEAIGVGRRGEG